MEFSFRKVDWPLFISFIILLMIGFAVLTSASQVLGFEKFGDSYYFLKQQSLHALAGAAAFLIFFFFPAAYWKRFAMLFYGLGILLLVSVFIPGLKASFGTTQSWVQIGAFTFQPVEFAKFFYILFLAFWFERKSETIKSFTHGCLPFLVYSGLYFLLVALQPDIGTLVVMVTIGVAVYFVSGAPLRYLAVLALVGLVVFGALIAVAPYRLNRVMVFLNPSLDPQGAGYHSRQAVIAVGSGGIFGVGFGKSQSILPEAPGDSVFAVYAEELGFVFSLALFALFATILVRGLSGAQAAGSKFEQYAAVGVVTWILVQAMVNIGAMIGLLPLTGIPLPFISYGGTALVAEMAGMGLLLNISRR